MSTHLRILVKIFSCKVSFRVSQTFCAFRDNIFFTCSDFIKSNALISQNYKSYEYKFIIHPPLNMHPKFRARKRLFSTLLLICFQEQQQIFKPFGRLPPISEKSIQFTQDSLLAESKVQFSAQNAPYAMKIDEVIKYLRRFSSLN